MEERKKPAMNWKTLEMPAPILGVLKMPAMNWKTLAMSEVMLEVLEKSGTLEELEKLTTMLETL